MKNSGKEFLANGIRLRVLTFNTYKYASPLFPFYSFDNDDMKSSKRHAVLLSLIFLMKCFSKSFLNIE